MHEQTYAWSCRGCRLGISYPEIYKMQCRALEALIELKDKNKAALPEIMIPLVSLRQK